MTSFRSTVYALAAALLLPGAAHAVPTFSAIWQESGTDTVAAQVGDVLHLDIILTAGREDISNFAVSAQWDDDLVPSGLWATNLPAAGFNFALGPGVDGNLLRSAGGACLDLDQGPFCLGLAAGESLLVGTLELEVGAGLSTDREDVALFFRPGFDGWTDTDGVASTEAVFNGASVNPIPEPNAALLLCCGLFVFRSAIRARSA